MDGTEDKAAKKSPKGVEPTEEMEAQAPRTSTIESHALTDPVDLQGKSQGCTLVELEEGKGKAGAAAASSGPAKSRGAVDRSEEDPDSELNILRREVRRLQGAVRITTLQAAVQQEELLELREESDALHAREAVLVSRLAAERRRVRATMAAAEALIHNLREMELDGTCVEKLEGSTSRRTVLLKEGRPRPQLEPARRLKSQRPIFADKRHVPFDNNQEEYSDDDDSEATDEDEMAEDGAEYEEHGQDRVIESNLVDDDNDGRDQRYPLPPELAHDDDDEFIGDSYTAGKARVIQRNTRSLKERDVDHHVDQQVAVVTSSPVSSPVVSTKRNTLSSQRRGRVRRNSHEVVSRTPKPSTQVLPLSAVSSLVSPSLENPLSPSAQSPRPSIVTTPMMVAAFRSPSRDSSDALRSPPKRQTPPPMSLSAKDVTGTQYSAQAPVPRVVDCVPTAVSFVVSDAHEGEIFAIASAPDGSLVASGGDDKIVRLYDPKLRRTSTTLLQCTRAVTALTFNPTGALVAAGMYDGVFRLWRKDASRKRVKWIPENVQPCHTGPVRKAIFDPLGTADAPQLYTASVDRSIKLTDLAAGKRPFVAYTPSAVLDMSVMTGKGVILSGHKDGGLRMWSAKDGGKPVGHGAKAHARAITSVSCLEDGFGVVTLGRDHILKLSDTRVSLDSTVREMEVGVRTASDWHRASLFGRHVACGMDHSSGIVGIWNVDSGKLVRKIGSDGGSRDGDLFGLLKGNPGCALIPLWSPFGLVTASAEKCVTYWV